MNMGSSLLSAPSSSSGVDVICDDSFDDSCSICLEPFSSLDPPSVTKCKHEYHLHCILEWSQRSNECPICSQHLVLKDPASQELLAGVKSDKNLRLRRNFNTVNQDNEANNDAAHVDDSDFEHRIMRNFSAIASRARNISRRRQMTPTVGPSQILPSVPITNTSNVIVSSPEHQNLGSLYYQSQPDSPGRSSSSELAAFSESLKTKISTASSRYKESISKSTRGLREKLTAHNDSVKEISRGVQREVSAGIAGIGRMIERLDITQKRAGVSVPLSNHAMGNSKSAHEVKGIEDGTIVQSLNQNTGETANGMNSAGGVQFSLAKDKN